jgi:hypothetical protein
LKSPAVLLEKLEIDGKVVEPKLVTVKAKNGAIADSYYIYHIEDPKGQKLISAYLKNIKDGSIKVVRYKL